MESIWHQTARHKTFEPLYGDTKTQVLVVGGGMAGILCAYTLQKAGVECVLVEADRICAGVTGNTTAKITVQHGLIYHKIIQKYSEHAAKMYLTAQEKAIRRFSKLCKDIPCGYENRDAYVYSLDDRNSIEKEIAAYDRLGYKATFCEKVDIPVEVAGAVKVTEQAQFHPLQFAYGLAEKLPVYENTKVLEFFKGGVVTNRGKIFADHIIVATHFPVLNKHGGYFLKLYQHRSYVLALKDAQLPDGMYVDENEKGMSFREYDGMLLLGGGSHRTGKQGGNWQELRSFADEHYPGSRLVTQWAAQDCMTLDGVPYIGAYGRHTPGLYVATGFHKWGMTSSMVAAMILTDMILGKANEFAAVFSPRRRIWHPQLAMNGVETLVNLLTPTAPRCPHMGCALKYNYHEHSWDCPCHGSRFTEEGKLIENPATDDKQGLL